MAIKDDELDSLQREAEGYINGVRKIESLLRLCVKAKQVPPELAEALEKDLSRLRIKWSKELACVDAIKHLLQLPAISKDVPS